MNRSNLLLGWSAAVGAMDAVTGLLLVFLPETTLGLMGIAPPSRDALVFLSWMGVFVAAVGLSYGLVLTDARRGPAVWAFTALVRVLVGVFVVAEIVSGGLALAWIIVAATDLLVAGVQGYGLRARWWKEGQR